MMKALIVIIWAVTPLFVCGMETPIIGILSQETFSISKYFPVEQYESFIAASYVKFIEGAGGRVVPIRIGKDRDYYAQIVNKTNGLLFPGGATWFNETGGYGDTGQILYDLALEINRKGVYYPILGICLGMELLAQVAIGGQEIRSYCSASKLALPLDFEKGFLTSKLFSNASKEIIQILATEAVTYNYHQYCFTKEDFEEHGLDQQFNVLATNRDKNGLEFISAYESNTYPFYGIQWHPEKVLYEFVRNYSIPHTSNSVKAAQYFANFFIDEARRNDHAFESWEEEQEALIYNYYPEFIGKNKSSYEQVYVFKRETNEISS